MNDKQKGSITMSRTHYFAFAFDCDIFNPEKFKSYIDMENEEGCINNGRIFIAKDFKSTIGKNIVLIPISETDDTNVKISPEFAHRLWSTYADIDNAILDYFDAKYFRNIPKTLDGHIDTSAIIDRLVDNIKMHDTLVLFRSYLNLIIGDIIKETTNNDVNAIKLNDLISTDMKTIKFNNYSQYNFSADFRVITSLDDCKLDNLVWSDYSEIYDDFYREFMH